MLPLSNLQIESVLSNHYHTQSTRHFCQSWDTIPKRVVKYPTVFILNTANAGQIGEHWIYLAFSHPNNPAEYFDSLGKNVAEYSQTLDTFLKLNGNGEYYTNYKQYQSSDSVSCGYFCLFFTDLRCQNIPYSKCLEILDRRNTAENESFVAGYVSKHMKDARPGLTLST